MSNLLTSIVGTIITLGFLQGALTAGHPLGAFLLGLCAFILGFNTLAYSSVHSSSKTRTKTIDNSSSTQGDE